jgi:hypothetical protein
MPAICPHFAEIGIGTYQTTAPGLGPIKCYGHIGYLSEVFNEAVAPGFRCHRRNRDSAYPGCITYQFFRPFNAIEKTGSLLNNAALFVELPFQSGIASVDE